MGPERVLGKVSRVRLVRASSQEESCQSYLQDVPLDKLPELAVLMLIVNVVLVFMLRRTKWVEVSYRDGSNQQQFAYFTDGSSFGMARGLGGADELHEAISIGIRQESEPVDDTHEAVASHEVSPVKQQQGAWVNCEDCGKKSFWLARQRGKVQKCPHCGGYMDC